MLTNSSFFQPNHWFPLLIYLFIFLPFSILNSLQIVVVAKYCECWMCTHIWLSSKKTRRSAAWRVYIIGTINYNTQPERWRDVEKRNKNTIKWSWVCNNTALAVYIPYSASTHKIHRQCTKKKERKKNNTKNKTKCTIYIQKHMKMHARPNPNWPSLYSTMDRAISFFISGCT